MVRTISNNRIAISFAAIVAKFADPEKLFMLFGTIAGTLMLIITPPFQATDEHTHFYRAYHISEGYLVPINEKSINYSGGANPRNLTWIRFRLPKKEGEVLSGGVLPKSVTWLGDELVREIAFQPDKKQSIEQIRQAIGVELRPEEKEFHFYYAVMYPSLPYIPSVLAIMLGKTWQASPIILMYMGRFGNMIVALLLVALAIRITPISKWGFFLLSLTPMATFQRAIISTDAFTSGISFVLIACFLQYAFGEKEQLGRKDLLVLLILTACISFSKLPYFLLILVYWIIPVKKAGSLTRYIGWFIMIGMGSASCIVLWRMATRHVVFLLPDNVLPEQQIQHILHHPMQVMVMIVNNYLDNAWSYFYYFIGVLGWVDTMMPPLLVISYMVILIFVALVEGHPAIHMNYWQRGVIATVILLLLGAISLGLYVTWTKVGSPKMDGISGRYFIPLSPLVLLLCYNRKISLTLFKDRLSILFGCYTIISLTTALVVLVHRYYIVS